MLNLKMENNTNDVAACDWFGNLMGDALVSPYEFQNIFGSTDPGQLTLAQLWSLPDPQGFARVIMDNQDCLNDTSRWGNGWGPISDGHLVSGFYADQISRRAFRNWCWRRPRPGPFRCPGKLNLIYRVRPRSAGCTTSRSWGPRRGMP